MSTTRTEDITSWVRLMAVPGVGSETARRLLSAFGLPTQIFSTSYGALAKVGGDKLARSLLTEPDASLQQQIDLTLNWCASDNHYLVTLADSAYPPALLDIPDPPPLLYLNGRLSLLQAHALGVVGSRNPTTQGIKNAEQFAKTLAEAGVTVVSGLAQGIDTAAHTGALNAGERSASTIAVIGTGIDIVYPARNRALAHRIAAEGLLVSEFPLGMTAMAHHFPRRNRIISGLSKGVLVVEAAAQSGSLITARQAGEQGRDVFAIPGSIHSPLSKGCHLLIKEGAKLVESAEDILSELHIKPPTAASPALANPPHHRAPDPAVRPTQPARPAAATAPATGDERTRFESVAPAQLLAAMGFEPVSTERLAQQTGIATETLLTQLLDYELSGQIERLPGGLYQRLQDDLNAR